jgi:hypothetical protein
MIVGGQKAKMIGLGGFPARFLTAVKPPSAPEVPNKTGINSASQTQGSRVVGEVPLRVRQTSGWSGRQPRKHKTTQRN